MAGTLYANLGSAVLTHTRFVNLLVTAAGVVFGAGFEPKAPPMFTQVTHPHTGSAEAQPHFLDLRRQMDEPPATLHWHPRNTLLFVVGTCGAFWSAVTLAFLKI